MWNDVPDGVLTMTSGSGELSGEGGMCVSCLGEEEIARHPAAWQAAAGQFPSRTGSRNSYGGIASEIRMDLRADRAIKLR